MPQMTFATSGVDLVGQTIDNGRLELISVLGVGAYGVVYLAIDLHAPTPVYLAVKVLLRTGLDARQRHFQCREIALHQLASRHTGVVTLHKVMEEGDLVFVIMDFYDEGDLFGMITERQRYLGRDDLIRKVFLQIIDAVEYCHLMGIFHRDLKPENILVTRGGEKVCIADFGLATSERTSADFGCGSTFYLSPECQGGLRDRMDHYSTEHNDLWSLGVILVNLTCGRNPWRQACPTDETFKAYIHNPDFLRTILPISHATNHILKGLFALDPAQRTPLRRLRREVMMVERFTMTDNELSTAHSAARAAAQAVRGTIPPKAAPLPQPAQPLPPIVQPVPVPVPVAAQQYKHTPEHIEHHRYQQHSYTAARRRCTDESLSGSSSDESFDDLDEFEIRVQGPDDIDTVDSCPDTDASITYRGRPYEDPFAFAPYHEHGCLREEPRHRRQQSASTSSRSSGSGSDGACQPATPTYEPVQTQHWAPQYGKCSAQAQPFGQPQYARASVRVAPVSPHFGDFSFA